MANEMTKKSSHERCRSISGTVIKFARRSNSSSKNLEGPANQESEPPLPHPRSSSFFNTLNAFVPRAAAKINNPHIKKEATTPASRPVQSPLKLPQRFSHPPPSLSSKYSCSNGTEPLIPKVNADGYKTTIMQRGLMKPSTNPPLPRSSTMVSRAPQQPGFMRSTSSSTAHTTVLPGQASSKYGLGARSSRLPSTIMSPESLSSVPRATKTSRISDCLETRTNTQKCEPNGGRYSNTTHISARSPELFLTSQIPEERKALTCSDPLDEEDSEEDSEDDYYEPTLETRLMNDNPSICGPPMVPPSPAPLPPFCFILLVLGNWPYIETRFELRSRPLTGSAASLLSLTVVARKPSSAHLLPTPSKTTRICMKNHAGFVILLSICATFVVHARRLRAWTSFSGFGLIMKGDGSGENWGDPGKRESMKSGACLRYWGVGRRGRGNEVIHYKHNGSNGIILSARFSRRRKLKIEESQFSSWRNGSRRKLIIAIGHVTISSARILYLLSGRYLIIVLRDEFPRERASYSSNKGKAGLGTFPLNTHWKQFCDLLRNDCK